MLQGTTILVLIWLIRLTSTSSLPACTDLKYTYSSRGVPDSDIPGAPVPGSHLQFCPSGPTCCTLHMERRLGEWSERQYRDAIYNRTADMATDLSSKARQIDDYVYILLNKAQREFHDMFTRTYGIMYKKNAVVFQEYFKDLKVYYDRGLVNPADSTESFFRTLYQKMFQMLNVQYNFDSLYLSCVKNSLKDIRPFGDVPRKLANSVKWSLVAARALSKALKTAHHIAFQLTKVEPQSNCLEAIKRMSSCPACQGVAEVKPCNGYCVNIMKGCLAHHYEIDKHWDDFIASLSGLTERLIGSFNLEMNIEPISIKISDAIMNFQEAGFQVTQQVFDLCGTPRLTRRDTSSFVFEKRLEKVHRAPHRQHKSEFELMLLDLKKQVKSIEGFWSLMPYKMCDTKLDKKQKHVTNLEDRETCWNGNGVGDYTQKVLEDGLANQMRNPEVPVAIGLTHSVLTEEKAKLERLTGQLKSAFQGLNIQWWDDGDSEGSGRFGVLEDDEDYGDERFDGSGDDNYDIDGQHEDDVHDEDNFYDDSLSYEDEILVPEWTIPANRNKNKRPENDVTLTEERGHSTASNTQTIHIKSRLSLAKAVLTYLLPVASCYLGGFLSDLPLSPWG